MQNQFVKQLVGEMSVLISDQSELVPLTNFEVEVPEPVFEIEVQLFIPSDEDLSLINMDELLRSVTKAIQDQIIQEEKAQLDAAQTDEKIVVVEVITLFQEHQINLNCLSLQLWFMRIYLF